MSAPADRPGVTAGRVLREVVLVGALLLVYQGTRLLGGRDAAAALDNAREVLALEQRLGVLAEQDLQALVLAVDPLVRAANAYYAAAHLPVTVLVLVWLLLRRPRHYSRARNALVLGSGVALAVYLLVPVAPPRMLPGFVDTAALHGMSVYGDPASSALANQYAALPSLHVGWAVLVAIVAVSAARTRWRWLWLLHPGITVLVVVITANHFWVDALAGGLLLSLAWLTAPRSRPPDPQAVPVAGVPVPAQERRRVPSRRSSSTACAAASPSAAASSTSRGAAQTNFR